MVAENPVRCKRTARELAKQLGISQSTVKGLMAEPQADYLARANTKRQQVAELHATGLSVRAITERLDISKGNFGRYIRESKKISIIS